MLGFLIFGLQFFSDKQPEIKGASALYFILIVPATDIALIYWLTK
jgi:hypothetical protein